MERQSYIETFPREIGIELLDRMPTEQVERVLYNNLNLLSRYGDYLDERLEEENEPRKAYHRKLTGPRRADYLFKYAVQELGLPEETDRMILLFNPQTTKFMNLPYRNGEGRGFYSYVAFTLWLALFLSNNKDSDGLIVLNPRDQHILRLPRKVTPEEFTLRLQEDLMDVDYIPNKILTYLRQEEDELDGLVEDFLTNRPSR